MDTRFPAHRTQTKGKYHAHILEIPTQKTWFHKIDLDSNTILKQILLKLCCGHTFHKKIQIFNNNHK